jgi:polysaccharide biosynthesis protein PslG
MVEVVQAGNLRTGPGTAYGRVGTVKPGQQFEVTGKHSAGGWWQIAQVDGKPAWIAASLVRVHGPLDAVKTITDVPPPPQPAPALAHGVWIAPGDDMARVVSGIKGLGFGWGAMSVRWASVEAEQGKLNWDSLDKVISALAGSGLKVFLDVTGSPAWAKPADTTGFDGPPPDLTLYAAFTGQLAARYCGKVSAIQIWNQPNINFQWGNQPPDPARYMEMLKLAHGAIKAACPQTLVVSAAPVPTGAGAPMAMNDVDYLSQMYAHGLKSLADAVGATAPGYNNPPDAKVGYSDPNEPSMKSHRSFFFRDTLESYRQVMQDNGDGAKKLWVTQFGWGSSSSPGAGYEYMRDNTPEEQAQYAVKSYAMARAWGWVGAMFLLSLDYGVAYPNSNLAYFSLLRSDGPTPAYRALAAMPK